MFRKQKRGDFLFVVFILSALAGCTNSNFSKPNAYDVSGIISNQSGYPVRALVTLGEREVVTKKDGVFQFENVTKGTHEFTATASSSEGPSRYLESYKSNIIVDQEVVHNQRLKFIIADELGDNYDFWVYTLLNASGRYVRISARLTGRDIELAPGQSLRLQADPGEYSFMFSIGSGWRETKIWVYNPTAAGTITADRIYTH